MKLKIFIVWIFKGFMKRVVILLLFVVLLINVVSADEFLVDQCHEENQGEKCWQTFLDINDEMNLKEGVCFDRKCVCANAGGTNFEVTDFYFGADKDVLEKKGVNVDKYLEKVELPENSGEFYNVVTIYDKLLIEAIVKIPEDVMEALLANIALIKINDEGASHLLDKSIKCEVQELSDNGKDVFRCKYSLTSDIVGYKRGDLLKAVINFGNSNHREEFCSDEVAVAEFNYYFVPVSPGDEVTNYEGQYGAYTQLSAVNDDFESVGKPIYIVEVCDLLDVPMNADCGEEDLVQAIGAVGLKCDPPMSLEAKVAFGKIVLKEADKCVARHFKWDPELDRIVAMSNFRGSFTKHREDTIFVAESSLATLSHELGHTYDLCDEYAWTYPSAFGIPGMFEVGGYRDQDEILKKLGSSCKNEYPWCAIDNPDNPIQKNFQAEKSKIYKDGKSFGKWLSYAKDDPGLTDEELFALRSDSPCSRFGAECKYGGAECPSGYYMLENQFGADFEDSCPPEKNSFPQEVYVCCISHEKLQELGETNCWWDFTAANMNRRCAGMPLFDEGDLNSPFRSIMGAIMTESLDKMEYPPEAKFPLNTK